MPGWIGPAISAGASLIGGLLGGSGSSVGDSYELAKKIGKKQIQWRVKDAKKAGIHPMYAVGAPAMSAPSFGGGGYGLGDSVAAAGQDIGRAVESISKPDERAYTSELRRLQLQRGELENTLLASKIARLNQAGGSGPSMPLENGVDIAGNPRTSNLAIGVTYETNPRFSDVQTYSQRYGEPAEWLMAPVVAGADAIYQRRNESGYESSSPWGDDFGLGY